ncbi:YchJ family protein [Streptacidiphilus sp. PB12-B1b]|uniref:YchJ family protein n=1 Tax=Streptacidiphilus sp. PB12-B1b TaxID=2705012 RepID=UPI001CDC540C|nr:YchJ family protein [Streptacidiphilus sp. PB12-B1b]
MAKVRARTRTGASPRPGRPPGGDGAVTCPCGLGRPYAECCGVFHAGRAAAPTAEALMRSRFSAFALGDEPYLLRSWHPRTRPSRLGLDPAQHWLRLEVLATEGGSAFHSEGAVEFRAYYSEHGQEDVLHEHSRFVRVDGAWVYLDGRA